MMRKREGFDWGMWVARASLAAVFVVSLGLMTRQVLRDVEAGAAGRPTSFQESFPGLETAAGLPAERREAIIRQANAGACACRCGFTVASCLNLDPSCPDRPENLRKVREMVEEARKG